MWLLIAKDGWQVASYHSNYISGSTSGKLNIQSVYLAFA